MLPAEPYRNCNFIFFTGADFQISKNLKNAAQIYSIWVYLSVLYEFNQYRSVFPFAPFVPTKWQLPVLDRSWDLPL